MVTLRDRLGRFVSLETQAARDYRHGGSQITGIARTLAVRAGTGAGGDPHGYGGGGALFVRSWPAAVLVSAEGRVTRVRIVDVTRWAQIGLVLAAAAALYEMRRRKSARKE